MITCLEYGGATASGLPTETLTDLPAMAKPESGLAIAWGQKEYERRHQKREAVLNHRFGRLAGLVKFLVDDPEST